MQYCNTASASLRIRIRDMLKAAARDLENPAYKAAKKAVTWFAHF